MTRKMRFNKRLDKDKRRMELHRKQKQKMRMRGGLIVRRGDN